MDVVAEENKETVSEKLEEKRSTDQINLGVRRENFSLYFGCNPEQGVIANTKMIKDSVDILVDQYQRMEFAVDFPSCYDDLKGEDANFEIVCSQTTQPLRLPYKTNISERKLATIFVHTHCRDLEYENAMEKAMTHKKLFEEWLCYDEVVLMENPTRE